MTFTNGSSGTTTKDLVYDEVGNPTTYFNGSKTLNMSWRYGRQLSGVVNGSSTYSYTYDVDGIRKSKTVNCTVHDYVTLDGKVVREIWGSTAVIDYFYDNEGKPYKISVGYGDETYTGYYLLNQQGDVIAIIDADGDVLVEYTYNAWGKQTAYSTSTTAGSRLYTYNALKYRGYYYDSETGFYYLGSRYYDPVIGRFINADTADVLTINPTALTDKNLYAYCDNNPIMRKDDGGEFWNIAISIAIGASVNIAATAVAAGVTGQKCDAWDYLMAGISGAGMAIAGLPGASVVSSVVGIANTVYAGVKSKMNGASCGGAIIAGVTAGLCASSSVALAAKMPDMSYAVSGVVDLVFCTGFNSISAAAYRGVTPNSADTTTLTVKSVNKSSKKNNYNTKTKKKSKCSAMRTGCSTDYFRYLYNRGMPF